MRGKLPAQFASDWAASARNKDHSASDIAANIGKVNANLLAPEKILNFNIADFIDADLAVCKLKNTRKRFKPARGVLADIQNFAAHTDTCRRHCHNNLVNIVFFDSAENVAASADDFNAEKILSPFWLVIVDKANDFVFGMCACAELPQGNRRCLPRADYHRPPAAVVCPPVLAHKSVWKTHTGYHYYKEYSVQHGMTARNAEMHQMHSRIAPGINNKTRKDYF